MTPVAELKLVHRATWAAGDYAAVARHIDEVPPRDLLPRMDIHPGHEVLDVATGTGNLAIRAAAAGAQVSASTSRPSCSRRRGRAPPPTTSSVDWVEGDAEELPYEDECFDRVLSAFGVQFAPRHEIVAHELAGVTRPGGRIGLVNWTPEGVIGELFKIMGSYLPAPPAFASPPPLWGSKSHVRAPVRGHPRRARLRPRHTTRGASSRPRPGSRSWRPPTARPSRRASELTAEGRWEDCRADMLALAERRNEATDGSLHMEAEYLITIGHKVD